ncbi:hypothetical protein VCR1J2_590295 [Vibrio coralliirubri]|nr:hypothetical protein VCR1J2_590295 [Vibrio coralliirubri]CDU02951.1 hypothetical protein VCR8J2_850273 [Vibrio coralliirubri]
MAHATSRRSIPPPKDWRHVPTGISPWSQDKHQALGGALFAKRQLTLKR